jgi:4-amino-4-deoxy-L-arabinose transferase-like glycosyltransferase
MQSLYEFVERRPRAAFLAFATLHLIVWTALPAALYPNLPLDVIEALTYGREWQLGYDKLPPLPWWLIEIAHRLIGHDFAYYALAQAAVVAAYALIWTTARPLVGPVGALVALLIVDGLHYFHYTAAKFNHDVIQLPLWALAGYAYRGALREGRLISWALLGIALGAALWAKYFVVVLALPLALFLLIDRDARQALKTPGPYLAGMAALVVGAPHIWWLFASDFLPFAYAASRASLPRGILDHLLRPLEFAAGQFLFLLPALAVATPFLWRRQEPRTPTGDAFDRRILTLLAFGPFATVIALSAISGRATVAMWGYPLWLFFGLWIVLEFHRAAEQKRFAQVVSIWAAVFAVFALAFIVNYAVLPHFDQRYRASLFPGDRLAVEISARFRAATGRPLAYVVSEMWTGGNIGHYAPERPRVLIDGEPRRAPWIDLADLRARGAAVVWTRGDLRTIPPQLQRAAPNAQVQPPFKLKFRWIPRELEVGWAILPPQPAAPR